MSRKQRTTKSRPSGPSRGGRRAGAAWVAVCLAVGALALWLVGRRAELDTERRGRSARPVFVAPESLLSSVVARAEAAEPRPRLRADRAYDYLLQVCRLGPRPSDSPGMTRQQILLADHFTRLGARVDFQPFTATHPLTRAPARLQNLIVTWFPETTQRILVCCHYDTRPYPDRDRLNPRGRFIGANDGGSGVALLMELGHHIRQAVGQRGFGVDFVFFDGEEFVLSENDPYFLGSTFFANQYKQSPPSHRYSCGVLLDMVGDRQLNLYMERNSVRYARDLTRSIWNTAARLGVREFIPQTKWEIRDDHIPLNETAGIPTTDIIDFDYPYWHTTQDLPTACSGQSLVKVGRVVLEWIAQLPPVERK